MSSNLAGRIREARIKANLSQNQLAKQAGLAQSALHALESGKTKMTTRLSELAKALNISVEWLLHGTEPTPVNGLAETVSRDWWLETFRPDDSKLSKKFADDDIPVLSTASAQNADYMVIGEEVAATFRHPMQIGVKGACALHVLGDAMYPRYADGELIYCVKTISPVANQDVVLIRKTGLALVCRLIKLSYPERKLIYMLFNPSSTVEIDLGEVEEIWPVVGRR